MDEKSFTDITKSCRSENGEDTACGVPDFCEHCGPVASQMAGGTKQVGSDPAAGGNSTNEAGIAQASVYVFGSRSGSQKIGISWSPELRFRKVKLSYPHLECVSFEKVFLRKDALKIEALAHRKLHKSALQNEMFDVTTEEAIKAVIDAVYEYGKPEMAATFKEAKMASQKVQIMTRIDPELAIWVKDQAAIEDRRVTAYIERVLKAHRAKSEATIMEKTRHRSRAA